MVYSQSQSDPSITIPIEGNSWFSSNSDHSANLKSQLEKWQDNEQVLHTYVHFGKPGTFKLYLNLAGNIPSGKYLLQGFGKEKSFQVVANAQRLDIGTFEVSEKGYYDIRLQKQSKSVAPLLVDYEIQGDTALLTSIDYVKTNEGNFFYWGRRGPSVHMSYEMPVNSSTEYFYNEIVVPEGNDVVGSYFMANGFAEGYFGIQVNSPSERRVLFSVWSPYETDNPKEIPENERIKLLSKGQGVYTGEFGNEGSGGQSYLKYNWKAGETYKFLLRGRPVTDNYSEYTAWFWTSEWNEWRLIAKFSRPKTHTYLKRVHSFLENFIPQQGNIGRKVLFKNQWTRDREGKWTELTKGHFTVDQTGSKSFRLDYAGGVMGSSFFLQNCGFFNERTLPRSVFTRMAKGNQPQIDVNTLPE